MINKFLVVIVSALISWGGYQLALNIAPPIFLTGTIFASGMGWEVLGAIVGLVIGWVVSSFSITWFWRGILWFEARLGKMPLADIVAGAVGLIIGLIIANLIGSAFYRLPVIGYFVPMVGSLFLGYLSMRLAVKKREEIFSLFCGFPWFGKDRGGKEAKEDTACMHKILDTSVIIDGRIADICKSGFLDGTLIIPVFVLEELQRIADSSDLLKRNRGRRGLEMLNRIQKEVGVKVQIETRDFDDISEVDSKLIKLAQVMDGKVITNDYNLNKVAEIQGVAVLNINELANAVKPVMLPGEEMIVQVIKDGKELGQGVAYLDDGTMIVVDGGKKHIGESIGVMVTSVLQTAAGRMIFAKPKSVEKAI